MNEPEPAKPPPPKGWVPFWVKGAWHEPLVFVLPVATANTVAVMAPPGGLPAPDVVVLRREG